MQLCSKNGFRTSERKRRLTTKGIEAVNDEMPITVRDEVGARERDTTDKTDLNK